MEWCLYNLYILYTKYQEFSLLFLTCIEIESVNKTFNFQHFIELFYSKSTCFRPKNSLKGPHWQPCGWIGWGWIVVISERFCPESMIQMSESSDFFWLVGWLVAEMCEIVCFWVVVSNIFYFHPYLEKVPILTNIFQRGWNHQLGLCVWIVWKDLKLIFNAGARGGWGVVSTCFKAVASHS